MSGREAILGRIRKSIGSTSEDAARRNTVETRLAGHPANLIPERATVTGEDRIALFVRHLEGQAATIDRIADTNELPDALGRYLRDHNLPARARMGTDPRLNGVDWSKGSVEQLAGPAEADDVASLSHAHGGEAESGTLFLTTGPDSRVTLHYVPENHVVVLAAKDIGGSYEDAWNQVRKTYGPRKMPRTVNLISGPSRTADIEQTIIMGAHGPRRLHVIIVG